MEIVKMYTQNVPSMKLIGIKYSDTDRVEGSFGFHWQQFFELDKFTPILEAAGGEKQLAQLYEDATAPLGYMRYQENAPFEYWIGLFVPENTVVPEGYQSLSIEASKVGICWYLGKEPEIYAQEHLAMYKLQAENMTIKTDKEGYINFFERYSMERFVDQDTEGSKILDIGFFVE